MDNINEMQVSWVEGKKIQHSFIINKDYIPAGNFQLLRMKQKHKLPE